MKLFIKKAENHEVSVIHQITQDAFAIYAKDLGLPHVVSALNETCEDIEKDMEDKTVLIAYYKGEPVGSVRYKMFPNNMAYITRFGVKAEAQGRGVGRALIKTVEEQTMGKDAHIITLHTASKMTSLVKFYYSLGFYIHSTTTDRGYIRALLCKELVNCIDIPLIDVNIK